LSTLLQDLMLDVLLNQPEGACARVAKSLTAR
jgi:hypothetical protein